MPQTAVPASWRAARAARCPSFPGIGRGSTLAWRYPPIRAVDVGRHPAARQLGGQVDRARFQGGLGGGIGVAADHAASVTVTVGPSGQTTAALLIKMLTRHSSAVIRVIAPATWAGSAGNTPASPPRSRTVPATSSSSSAERASTATRAPAAASSRAMARRMPRPAPVTRASSPSKAASPAGPFQRGQDLPRLGTRCVIGVQDAAWSRRKQRGRTACRYTPTDKAQEATERLSRGAG